MERQSSMASSTEEMSAGNNDLSGGSRRDDATTDFGVFKDFDFLEYESESIEVLESKCHQCLFNLLLVGRKHGQFQLGRASSTLERG